MTYTRAGLGATQAGENYYLAHSRLCKRDGTNAGIIVLHGYGGDAFQAPINPGFLGAHVAALADAGLMVLAVDLGGTATFGNSTFQTALTSAYNWLTGAGGAKTGKVGLMPFSMGMSGGLVWEKNNTSKVSGVFSFSGVTDLDFLHATAGYTPAYSTGGISQGQYTSAIDTAYGGNYAVNAVGFKIRDEYTTWNGKSPKVLCHATDDATIPIGQTQAFVAGVNDPNTVQRTVSSGGHSGLFNGVPTTESVSFFASKATW